MTTLLTAVELKKKRKALKVSAEELAAFLGWNKSLIYMIERGDPAPSQEQLRTIDLAVDRIYDNRKAAFA